MTSQFLSFAKEKIQPIWYPQSDNFEKKNGGHCTHDGFYMHQMPLVYMAVFSQKNIEPETSGLELSALLTGPPLAPCTLR